YKWQFQKDSSTLQNPPAQLFTASGNNMVTLWVNKNGCADTIYQKLTIRSQPDVTMLVSNSVVCLGSPVVFDAKPKNNSADTLNYFWNLGDGKDSAAVKSASFAYTASGTYPVLLRTTSNFGCKQELHDTVAVSPTPRVFVNAPIDICKNGTVIFTSASAMASSTQFLWHFPDGTTSTKQNPEPKTYNTAGVNNISLIASIGKCYDTAYHQLTVHDNPLVNLTTSAQRVCAGDSVQLTAHNGKNYQWTINNAVVAGADVASPRLLPSADTKYSVLAIDNFGCKNWDSLTVRVTKQQYLSVASTIVNVCKGNKATLSASGTDVYNWIDGSNLNATDIANPVTTDSAQNKTYTVIGTDQYKCFTDTAHVQVIVRTAPVIEMTNNINNITTPVGAPTQLSATSASPIVKWNWQPATYLSCNNCDAPTTKPRQNIRYLAEGTDSYGCIGSDTLSITVVCKESTIGIPDVFSPNGDGRNDRFGIAGYGIKNIRHFVIFGRNGNKVFERNNVSPYDSNAQWDGMCNNAYMPTGTYVYIIEAVCDAGEVYNVKGTVTLIR
ncbi:MAG: PKD domain-containing protein, partial [Bacteroidota bacterium]|nr:PKD domain-containing protein [Bacteroidota bacterium]